MISSDRAGPGRAPKLSNLVNLVSLQWSLDDDGDNHVLALLSLQSRLSWARCQCRLGPVDPRGGTYEAESSFAFFDGGSGERVACLSPSTADDSPNKYITIDFRTILGDLNRLYASTQDNIINNLDQKLNYDSGTSAHPPGQDCNRHIIAIASNIGAVIIPGPPPP